MTIPARVLGIGVVGLGVGEQHARAFHAHPTCEVRSVFDLEVPRAVALAQEFPGCGVPASFDEMLADRRLDALAIASFDDAHYAQVMAALEAGKHVFVEKPICRTQDELSDIKRRWQAAPQLKLRSNLVLRAAPLYSLLRERIKAGDLGRVYSFDGDYLYGRIHKITDGWRKSVADYSVMEGGGIHLVDLLLWLSGERPVSVTAAGNRVCTEGTSFQYNDFVAATFNFDSGLIARITANFGCVHRHQHVVRVFGTQATFLADDCGPRSYRSRDPAAPAERWTEAAVAAGKGDLVPGFVAAILSGSDDAAETQSFFDGISVCLAADRATVTGNRERIEYV